MLDLGHLPPGTPALLLIVGGLALVVPAALGILITTSSRTDLGRSPPRSVLVAPRTGDGQHLDLRGLTLVDQALERVYREGHGDPRIVHADPHRKLVRVTGCACGDGGSCEATREALERAVAGALGRRPQVSESGCHRGRCDFVVAY